jgi:2-keto-4-pentenoate hydratase
VAVVSRLSPIVGGFHYPIPIHPENVLDRSGETIREARMLDPSRCREAAQLLVRHWEQGTRLAELPPDLRPSTRAEGYAIQSHFLEASRQPLFGWKIAGTSEAGQRHINVDAPLAGRLLAEKRVADGAAIPIETNNMRVAEVEFAFRFGKDLAPRATSYQVDEVVAAVASLHPAIEIPDSRYDDFCIVGAPQLIADNACAHLFILGPATEVDWRRIDLAEHRVSGMLAGKGEQHGMGANALGDPRIALAWLVNELSALGITMAAGQTVITGTCVKPLAVLPGDEVIADYGIFGTLSARFI